MVKHRKGSRASRRAYLKKYYKSPKRHKAKLASARKYYAKLRRLGLSKLGRKRRKR